jgi:hypothetical protein
MHDDYPTLDGRARHAQRRLLVIAPIFRTLRFWSFCAFKQRLANPPVGLYIECAKNPGSLEFVVNQHAIGVDKKGKVE